MRSEVIKIEAGTYRVRVTWTSRVINERVDLLFRENNGHAWEKRHEFHESGEREFILPNGEAVLAFSPGELARYAACTRQLVTPPTAPPTHEERIRALEKGEPLKPAVVELVSHSIN